MGSPAWNSWAEGLKLANAINYQFIMCIVHAFLHIPCMCPSGCQVLIWFTRDIFCRDDEKSIFFENLKNVQVVETMMMRH